MPIGIDSIFKLLKSADAFAHSQKELDALPSTCSHVANGKRKGLYAIYDGGTVNVLRFSKNKPSHRRFYAPHAYLNACYPYNQAYGILLSLVNTSEKLWSLVTK